MRYEDTVKKANAFLAKEPEFRERYRKTLETLEVSLPPADASGELLPYRKPDDLFRTARQLKKGAEVLGDLGAEVAQAAESTERFAIGEKAKITARRQIRDLDEEHANDIVELMDTFLADAVDTLHHLKRLAKIENNPNGYYTQQYRRIYGAYRQAMHNLHGRKARGRGRKS